MLFNIQFTHQLLFVQKRPMTLSLYSWTEILFRCRHAAGGDKWRGLSPHDSHLKEILHTHTKLCSPCPVSKSPHLCLHYPFSRVLFAKWEQKDSQGVATDSHVLLHFIWRPSASEFIKILAVQLTLTQGCDGPQNYFFFHLWSSNFCINMRYLVNRCVAFCWVLALYEVGRKSLVISS